jgi:1-acyl-sn-glycerol-3-phosphate acyltransferase
MPLGLTSIFSSTGPATWWVAGAAAYVVVMSLWWITVVPALRRGPSEAAPLGLLWRMSKLLLRLRQHPQFKGIEHFESVMQADGPVLIVANHTGGVDPLLIQYAGPRLIRWMMAQDMMSPGTEDLWQLTRVISVDRIGPDATALRIAMRTLRDGGVVGVFPEGRITRPAGTLRPFQEGVGLLAARCGATVLPCWISDTPDVESMSGSVFGRSRSRVVFLEPVQYERSTPAADVASDLRDRIAAASGWPKVDEMMPLIVSP